MTGYTVHTGASKKFVSGWDSIFGDDTKKTAGSKKKKTEKKVTAKAKGKSKAKKKIKK